MIEKVVFNLIKRHIVTKLIICTRIARGQREGHEEWTASSTTGGAASYKVLKKKLYDFSPQLGLVESSYFLVQLNFVFSCVVYWVKKFRSVGITISVYVLNKSRGSEMHWVGGGG